MMSEMPNEFHECRNAAEYYVERHALGFRAQKAALVSAGQTLTYDELFRAACRASNVFRNAGLGRGDRILLALPDSLLFAVVFFGALRIGIVPVPISPGLKVQDYQSIITDCSAEAVIATRELILLLANLWRSSEASPRKFWAVESEVEISFYRNLQADLATAIDTEEFPCESACPNDIALIQYTSGSTGHPKGVVHLHRGLLAVSQPVVQRWGLRDTDVIFSAAKLSFGYGLGNSLLFPLSLGATTILLPGPADPFNVFNTIALGRPTVFFGVPSLYARMLAVHETHPQIDLGRIRMCVSAGEPLSVSVFERWRATFGLEIVEALGSTECLHVYLSNTADMVKPGSVGTPLAGWEIDLREEDTQPSASGEPRMLYAKSCCCGVGYWNQPEQTAQTMRDGWVRTGDYFLKDDEGFYFFVGRADDVIKVAGLKVSPIEVEQRLLEHSSVHECAVVGTIDPDGATCVTAHVCLRADVAPTDALRRELKLHLKARLSRYKIPGRITFVTELPKTTTGKISRSQLRTTPHSFLTDLNSKPSLPSPQ